MNLPKYKWWRVILHRMTAKQHRKIEQTHPVFRHSGKVQKGGEH